MNSSLGIIYIYIYKIIKNKYIKLDKLGKTVVSMLAKPGYNLQPSLLVAGLYGEILVLGMVELVGGRYGTIWILAV